MDKVHVYMYLCMASIKSAAGNITRLLPSPFLVSNDWFLVLAEAFRNDHVAAFRTTFGATEKKERDGYVTVLYVSKMTQLSSTANRLEF